MDRIKLSLHQDGGVRKELVALTVDITDPVVLSTIAQTAVLTLTLVIFTMSFRSQNNANKEAAYQRVLDDHTDAIRIVVDKPELSKFQNEMTRATVLGSDAGPRSVERHDGSKLCYVAVRTFRENASSLQKEVD